MQSFHGTIGMNTASAGATLHHVLLGRGPNLHPQWGLVNSDNIANNAILNRHIATDAVDGRTIAPGSITNDHIRPNLLEPSIINPNPNPATQFQLSAMPRGAANTVLTGMGTGSNPEYRQVNQHTIASNALGRGTEMVDGRITARINRGLTFNGTGLTAAIEANLGDPLSFDDQGRIHIANGQIQQSMMNRDIAEAGGRGADTVISPIDVMGTPISTYPFMDDTLATRSCQIRGAITYLTGSGYNANTETGDWTPLLDDIPHHLPVRNILGTGRNRRCLGPVGRITSNNCRFTRIGRLVYLLIHFDVVVFRRFQINANDVPLFTGNNPTPGNLDNTLMNIMGIRIFGLPFRPVNRPVQCGSPVNNNGNPGNVATNHFFGPSQIHIGQPSGGRVIPNETNTALITNAYSSANDALAYCLRFTQIV